MKPAWLTNCVCDVWVWEVMYNKHSIFCLNASQPLLFTRESASSVVSVPSERTMVAGVVDFLRLVDRPYAGGATSNFLLQTAAVRYRLRDRATRQPFTLDLLSTVHLAEPSYYSGLQEACSSYDRVLFEVIADGSLAPRDAASGTRRLLQPLQATPAQRELAARHRVEGVATAHT